MLPLSGVAFIQRAVFTMICKFEGRLLFPAGPACVQFEAALLQSVALPPVSFEMGLPFH